MMREQRVQFGVVEFVMSLRTEREDIADEMRGYWEAMWRRFIFKYGASGFK